MTANEIFGKVLRPSFPPTAIGLERGVVTLVLLGKRGARLTLQRAAHVTLDREIFDPNFDAQNISDPDEFAAALADLATRTGLEKQVRWSVSLPEDVARTTILALETKPASRNELEEMLQWKIERAFGTNPAEMRVARRRLRPDREGRERYLVTGITLRVLDEYEAVFAALGWKAGLILPRHLCEAWWLLRDERAEDSLLVSLHAQGFTGLVIRMGEPLVVRRVVCDADERLDELHRFLLFYRDRLTRDAEDEVPPARLLVIGSELQEAVAVATEALESPPQLVGPSFVGLDLPDDARPNFGEIAAPAALASLAWQ
ncbi:MAG: hypothetical protein C4334_04805 [Pyrinomonas sp.]|uniref:hypothetical protein n=1 Tax=Pyrinomonas sp. TaxID=2080306 RepID=UPI0033276C01